MPPPKAPDTPSTPLTLKSRPLSKSIASSPRMLSVLLLDEIGALSRDRDHRGVDVARGNRRHDGCIDDAQSPQALYFQVFIYDGADATGGSRMEHRLSHSAAVVEPIRVALYPRPGQVFGANVIAQGSRVDEAPYELQALDHDAAVVLGSEVVVADGGRGGRVRGAQVHRAARLHLELRYGAGEAGMPVQDPAAPGSREIDEVELRVGPLQVRPGATEPGGMAGPYLHGPFPQPEVPQ